MPETYYAKVVAGFSTVSHDFNPGEVVICEDRHELSVYVLSVDGERDAILQTKSKVQRIESAVWCTCSPIDQRWLPCGAHHAVRCLDDYHRETLQVRVALVEWKHIGVDLDDPTLSMERVKL